VLIVEDRDFVRRFLDHHNNQWKLENLYLSSLEAVEKNVSAKTLAVMVSMEMVEVSAFKKLRAEFAEKFPQVAVVVIESSDTTPVEELGKDIGMLHLPLSFMSLFAYLDKSAHPAPAAEEAAEVDSDVGKLNLLMAEDNKINQMIAQTFLKSLGHTVKIVDNGDLAVKAVAQTQYDCILMDVMMPVMDGITATVNIRTKELSAQMPRTPIVALTAAGESSLRDECLGSGMDECLFKPFRKMELQNTLAKVVKAARLQQQQQ